MWLREMVEGAQQVRQLGIGCDEEFESCGLGAVIAFRNIVRRFLLFSIRRRNTERLK
jgi:hypothetical protein